ncbi:MAG TPA: amidohydrolase family protein [Candidatus Nanoarchaeia archaeon]|nr:amidohydrolase family protein [Candidatus Nanoarchaeia archaeon]
MPANKYIIDSDSKEVYNEICKNLIIIDCHTHIGEDIDGHKISSKQLIRSMDFSKINKSISFPLNNPNYSKTFSTPNDLIWRSHQMYPERIIPFFRLNPNFPAWKKECKKRIEQGFTGIKLHPRSQAFRISAPAVRDILAQAEKHNLIVLIHTGLGVRNLVDDLKRVIREFAKVKFILGHAAFIDITRAMKSVADKDNVLFETSTVRMFDLFDLFKEVSHKRVCFGSDIPYYDQQLSLDMLITTALMHKKTPSQIQEMIGGNIIQWLK